VHCDIHSNKSYKDVKANFVAVHSKNGLENVVLYNPIVAPRDALHVCLTGFFKHVKYFLIGYMLELFVFVVGSLSKPQSG